MDPYLFISYRRSDDQHAINRLRSALDDVIDAGAVFIDYDAIPGGSNYRDVIAENLDSVDLVAVVIGRNWDAERLADPADLVRIEIETALASNKVVIPILLDNTPMPPAKSLPPSIKDLADRQAQRLRPGRDFERDIEDLVATVSSSIPTALSIEWKPVRLILGDVRISFNGDEITSGKMTKGVALPPRRVTSGTHHLSVETSTGGVGKTTRLEVPIDRPGRFHALLSYRRANANVDLQLTRD